jgi:hypothetical protein
VGVNVIETAVHVWVFVCDLADHALALCVLHVVVADVVPGEAKPAKDGLGLRERPQGSADIERVLIVGFGPGVAIAVVVAGVNLAVVLGKVRVERHTGVGRVVKAFTLGERRALEAVAIDTFLIVEQRSLLNAETDPAPFGIQSSRLTCPKAYLMRNTRLSLVMLVPGPVVNRPLSRVTSGVMRNEMMWLSWPVTLI